MHVSLLLFEPIQHHVHAWKLQYRIIQIGIVSYRSDHSLSELSELKISQEKQSQC